ncbi:THO complex subunit 1 [Frankliniella occidentalis]|uniref:THO complex subunit 1 n=1 Tax=Frankliniella occidentalis TaxID=133901 RepID=A0A6J1RZS0_FRAOC|nr:THO complex subunit 1 [Frankliniella occidentalis]
MRKEQEKMAKLTAFVKMQNSYREAVNASSFSEKDVDVLQKKFNLFTADESDKKSALDQVLREHLLDQLARRNEKGVDDVSVWEQFVTHCIIACKRSLCSPTMPVVLLGDVFDALTLQQCEQLFAYVEENVSIWKEDMFFTQCKNNLLRMCNDLLRRLSRSQNTVFCGRILLFLAKFFPFSERSGLNVVSEFNLENLTEYGAEASDNLKEILEDENDQNEEYKADMKITVDYNLYSKFWSLQDYFRNPNQCYNKVHWKTFSSHSNNVLSAFSSYKLDDITDSKRLKIDSAPLKDKETKMEVDGFSSTSSQVFFAKYLTNQKLLELQLSDSNFRRYVLLQFLILFQYLDSQVKFKAENYELKPEQIEWVKETTELICRLIRETPPDGPSFLQAVTHILKREEQWSNWKNEGCKEFQTPGGNQKGLTDTDEPGSDRKRLKPRRKGKALGDLIRDSASQGKTYMGNAELTKLWNVCPDNLEACRGRDRDFLPSLDSYFEEAIEQSDPSAMVEDSYKKINDGNFGWRALRLLARRSPHFFTLSSNNISKLPEYLETMIRKIAKDRPTTGSLAIPQDEAKPEVLDGQTEENGADNEQEEDELLKTMKEEETKEDETEEKKPGSFNEKILDSLANILSSSWRKVASKLEYTKKQIEEIISDATDDSECARKWLQHYAEFDEDGNPDNLAYTLEGMGFTEAASVINEMT